MTRRISPSSNEGPLVRWRDGVQIVSPAIWCDARRVRDLCFLSHAQPSETRKKRPSHSHVLTTSRTMALLEAGGDPVQGGATIVPYSRPFSLGQARLELFPSGYLPGSASLWVEVASRRVVYTGPLNPYGTLAEGMEVRGADTLVVDAPLAHLGTLPPRGKARQLFVRAIERALSDRALPVAMAPTLGGAQEAVALLGAMGLRTWVHPKIAHYVAAYSAMGLPMPAVVPFHGSYRAGEALVWPLSLRNATTLRRVAKLRRIALTGLALDANAAERLGVDEAVPISDQIDLQGVVDYVRHSEAEHIYFTVGLEPALAHALSGRARRSVKVLGPPRQMDLFA